MKFFGGSKKDPIRQSYDEVTPDGKIPVGKFVFLWGIPTGERHNNAYQKTFLLPGTYTLQRLPTTEVTATCKDMGLCSEDKVEWIQTTPTNITICLTAYGGGEKTVVYERTTQTWTMTRTGRRVFCTA